MNTRRSFLKALGGLPIAAILGPSGFYIPNREIVIPTIEENYAEIDTLTHEKVAIFKFAIQPGSTLRWVAAPGQEIWLSDFMVDMNMKGEGTILTMSRIREK